MQVLYSGIFPPLSSDFFVLRNQFRCPVSNKKRTLPVAAPPRRSDTGGEVLFTLASQRSVKFWAGGGIFLVNTDLRRYDFCKADSNTKFLQNGRCLWLYANLTVRKSLCWIAPPSPLLIYLNEMTFKDCYAIKSN